MMSILFLINILFAVDLNWSIITDGIYELFAGNETSGLDGVIGNDPILIGAFIFLVLFILTLIFGLGMLVGSVVFIPTMFALFQFIPDLRIIVAIICGLVFGLGLHRLIKR